jgi:phosphatidylserine decarboxylase
MRAAWNSTRVKWYSIPVAAGIGFLAAKQLYKTSTRERTRVEEQDDEDDKRPKRRKRIRPSGPW